MYSNQYFVDAWWTFVLPSICLASMLINVINVLVLAKLRPLRPVYRRLFAKSVINSIYLFICMWKFVSKCGQFCELFYSARDYREKWSFWIQVYNFYLYGVVGRILAQCDLFIEILIALKRLRLLTSTCNGACVSYLLGTSTKLIVAISVLIYLPDVLFSRIVWQCGTFEQQQPDNSSSSSSTCMNISLRLEQANKELFELLIWLKILFVRVLLTVALIVLINAANCYQIRKKIKQIRKATAIHTEDSFRLRHDVSLFNRMLMWQSMIYIFGNVMMLALSVLVLVRPATLADADFDAYVLATNTPLFVSFGLTFFVYWLYDDKFRLHTRGYLSMRSFNQFPVQL